MEKSQSFKFKSINNFKQVLNRLSRLLITGKKKLIYVALGDSLVEGVGASHPNHSYVAKIGEHLSKEYKAKIINLGKKGSTSEDVLEEQVPKALAAQPDIITLSVGANDIRKHRSGKKFAQNIEMILKTLSKSKAKIVVTTLPDISKVPAIPKILKWYVRRKTITFNKIIEAEASNFGIIVCDLFHPSRIFSDIGRYISSDKLHLSDEGYTIWAAFLVDKLRHQLPR